MSGLAHRTFFDYQQYVYLQGGKARGRPEFLLAHLPKNTERFQRIFRRAVPHLKPGAVLCLGARTGAESLGAVAAGFAGSMGLDLHPVGSTVRRGDWHELPCPGASFANVYTNSLDHCLYLDRFAAHVKRVLESDGRFYLMATNRRDTADAWMTLCRSEALYWQTSDHLVEAVCAYGFEIKATWRDGKWGHYVLGVTA